MIGDALFASGELAEALAPPDPELETVRAAVISAYNNESGTTIDPAGPPSLEDGERLGRWLREISATRVHDLYGRLPRLPGLIFDGLEDKYWRLLQAPCNVCGVRRGFPGQLFVLRIAPRSYQYEKPAIRAAFRDAVADAISQRDLTHLGTQDVCLRLAYALAAARTTIDIDNITKLMLDALKGQLFNDDRQVVHLDVLKLHTGPESELVGVYMWPTRVADHSLDTLRHTFEVVWDSEPIMVEDYLKQ
jgi:Holliday junction resolvase RusA-like endonuclease